MSPERKIVLELPKDVLIETAQKLFDKANLTLEDNAGFRKAVARRFLRNLQSLGSNVQPGQIEFDSRSVKYSLDLRQGALFDMLSLSTTNENVEEEITIWNTYEVSEKGPRKDFNSVIRYTRTNWGDDRLPAYTVVNNSEAASKIREFLRRI